MTIIAALGPTNTGKTHRAVARMLEHKSGIIGLPLRLLAREVYDRVIADVGAAQVALVTGEEKRVPPQPRYWICTVESMPSAVDADFVGVDEIQLCAHPQRGHVFTDRLLHARGRAETWFMGAQTMWPRIRQLVPTATLQRHPRLSRLSHAGQGSLRSLPPRSAVIAFSIAQVYELAERLRQRRGGVAVVLGALSPRTRNAQVAMYQSGEVQYLVATDAVGMGLNMNVDHVAFAALSKFDGRESRPLDSAELAQIAGRAGRYRNDGTFGTAAPLPELAPRVVHDIEEHAFPDVGELVWRSRELDLRSIDALMASLRRNPTRHALRRVERADDFDALVRLAARPEVRRRADSPAVVELLWEVCQIPDYRKLLEDSHARLLGDIFLQLAGFSGYLDANWLDARVGRLDDPSGGIDALMNRIAFVRTFTYIANHARWVADSEHWRERTRDIEDRLSDALHDSLVARFVERGSAPRGRRGVRLPDTKSDHPFAGLAALRQTLVADDDAGDERRLVAAIVEAGDERLAAANDAHIMFDGRRIARLTRGVDLLRPDVAIVLADLDAGAHARVSRRLTAWIRDLVARLVVPLGDALCAGLSGAGRGVVYLLEQGLGTVYRADIRAELAGLDGRDRAQLRQGGVRLGAIFVYATRMLDADALRARATLCMATLPPGVTLDAPRAGATSFAAPAGLDDDLCARLGYPRFGPRAIRVDVAERVHGALAAAARGGAFTPPSDLASWLGCRAKDVPEIVEDFGYRSVASGEYVRTDRGWAR